MLYLSASAIKDYIDCPQRFYYRIHKSKQAKQTPAMQVGVAIHETIERCDDWILDEKGWEIFNSIVEEHSFNISYTPSSLQRYKRYLTNFNIHFRPLLTWNDDIEFKFSIPYKNIMLVGKMDRIVNQPNNSFIFDWKTSARPALKTFDPQAILYLWATDQLDMKAITFIKANLIDGSKTIYVRERDELNLLFSRIDGAIGAWETDLQMRIVGNQCKRCPFFDICVGKK
jgi:CRISPR/Cas system-associated exonuclease Cas4 (RecB family)